MKYRGTEIAYGAIKSPAGIDVPGWIISIDNRRTIAATKELAQTWVDAQLRSREDRDHE